MKGDFGADLRSRGDGPTDKPRWRGRSSTGLPQRGEAGWTGPTYYNRPQLKSAPFNNVVVGGYIFLAGVSGGSAILAAASRAGDRTETAGLARRGRYLTMLAPTLGSALLVWDLHTPQRFYMMMRVAKLRSPMSIGTWVLLAFTGFAGGASGAQLAADLLPAHRAPLGRLAALCTAPAALLGFGLSTYTAALLSATSTPLWAASPRTLAARFASSSIAAGAAALSISESRPGSRRILDRIASVALAAELAAAAFAHKDYERRGVAGALDSPWGRAEKWGVNVAGTMLPLALHAASAVLPARTGRVLSRIASAAILTGSALLRISIMGAGNVSADDPAISFRFSQNENLPKVG